MNLQGLFVVRIGLSLHIFGKCTISEGCNSPYFSTRCEKLVRKHKINVFNPQAWELARIRLCRLRQRRHILKTEEGRPQYNILRKRPALDFGVITEYQETSLITFANEIHRADKDCQNAKNIRAVPGRNSLFMPAPDFMRAESLRRVN